MAEERRKLRKVGSMWKNTRSDSKAVLNGEMLNEDGMRLRFMVVPNDYKREGSNEPDYRMLSGDDWEIDEYSRRQKDKEQAHGLDDKIDPETDPLAGIPF